MNTVREFRCNKSADLFCYVCGEYTLINQRRIINQRIKEVYKQYFNIDITNQDKCWVPHIICDSCRTTLQAWKAGKLVHGGNEKIHMRFGRPMIWRDPIDHEKNCYICMTNVYGYSGKNKHLIEYPSVESISLPVQHSDALPIPISPQIAENEAILDDDNDDENDEDNDHDDEMSDPLYIPDTDEPHKLTQGDLNDLVRDLNLSKNMSELLGSRLQQWSLLNNGMIHIDRVKAFCSVIYIFNTLN